ncbi:MAG: polymer-forming cytoskeletal protein [Anaerolineae bacterium]|nr:polymer-forming cytoskeletal protein [Anaerolineae bacterium]
MRRIAILVVAVVALLLVSAPAASAQGGVVSGDQVIDSGQTYVGNLVVPGGKLTIRQGGVLRGDVAILGGELDVAGTVQGDIVSMGGTLRLRDTAVVQGDITSVGGTLERASGARVSGSIMAPGGSARGPQVIPPLPGAPAVSPIPGAPVTPFQAGPRNPALDALGWLGRTLLLTLGAALLGVLAMLLLPRQMNNIGATLDQHTAASLGMGALTWIVWILATILIAIMTVLLLIVCIGLLGVPILVALSIILPIAVLVGWLATGLLVGHKLFKLFGAQSVSPLLAVAVGTILLTFLVNLLGLIPCGGPVLAWLATLPGLGAVVLTWFGSRPYRAGDPYLPSWRRGGPAPSTGPIPSAPYGGYGEALPPPAAATSDVGPGAAAETRTASIPSLDDITRSVAAPGDAAAAAALAAQGFVLPDVTPEDAAAWEGPAEATVETVAPPPAPVASTPPPDAPEAPPAGPAAWAITAAGAAKVSQREEPPTIVPWEETARESGEPEWLPPAATAEVDTAASSPTPVVVPWEEAAGPAGEPDWPAPPAGTATAAAVATPDAEERVEVPWAEVAGPTADPTWPATLADTNDHPAEASWQAVAGKPADPVWPLNLPGKGAVTPPPPLAPAGGDDLRRVLHIGPARARFLNGLGITTFAMLASLPPEAIERLFTGIDPETNDTVVGISLAQARAIQASAKALAEAQTRR